jgi:hypothetical protein
LKVNYPKVSIIVLNWNGKEDTIECLESLKYIDYPNYEIIVVDNASTDGSVECLQNLNMDIQLIVNKENIGYSKGNNVGILKAFENNTDYIMILNNDTFVDSNFLVELIKVAESDQKIGILGPKTYYAEPRSIIYWAGSKINWYTGQPMHIGQKEEDNGQYNDISKVDFVAGSCMLIKKQVIEKIGLLPNEYFLLWEDIDYSVNAKKNGYELVYVPDSKIWHKESVSIKKIKGLRLYYSVRNRFIFHKKYATKIQYLCIFTYFMLYQFPLITFYFSLKYRNLDAFIYSVKGLKDGVLF